MRISSFMAITLLRQTIPAFNMIHTPPPLYFHNILLLLLLLLLLPTSLAAAAIAASTSVPAVIVFGDSTVDAGNNNFIRTIARANFPPYGRDFPGGQPTGRFCNGRLATDFISESLGLPPVVPAYLDPAYSVDDFAKGVCFASAGTGIDPATSDELSVIPLRQQLEFFYEYQRKLAARLGRKKAAGIVGEAVYIVSIGTNDFIENYYPGITGRSAQFTVGEYQDFLIGLAGDFLAELHRGGARKVSFTGLSPFGCLPAERTVNVLKEGECVEEFNRAAVEFNVKLRRLVERLGAELPELQLRLAAIYDVFLHIIQNPASYGFENAERGCCGTGTVETTFLCNERTALMCEDADKYAFWDAIHPSQSLNRIFANLTLANTLSHFI